MAYKKKEKKEKIEEVEKEEDWFPAYKKPVIAPPQPTNVICPLHKNHTLPLLPISERPGFLQATCGKRCVLIVKKK